MSSASLQAVLLTALLLGSLYVLMATGLSLVWGALGIFNFAHGAMLMLGAYFVWTVSEGFGWGIGVGIVAGLAAMAAVGFIMERGLVAPFLTRPNAALVAIITTLSAALFLQNLVQVIFGPRLKQLPPIVSGTVPILGTTVSAQDLMTMFLAPVLLVGLWCFLKYTRIGLAIRAVEQNRKSSLLMGVPVKYVYGLTFALSAVLATVAGITLGTAQFVEPTMGDPPLLKAFIVIILGGLGSLGGTIAGAYIVALLEAICMSYLGLYWTPLVLFVVMILVLIVRPSGLFGLKEA